MSLLRDLLDELARLLVGRVTRDVGLRDHPCELAVLLDDRQATHLVLRHQPQSLAEVERLHIEKILRHHGGNRTRAAQELGISRATLINKIKAYGLDL